MKKMQKDKLIEGYYTKFESLARQFFSEPKNIEGMNRSTQMLKATKKNKATIYVIGNGGSAAIAEHTAIDFTKNAGLKSLAISGSPMLTTFSNDYGYENVFKKAIEHFSEKGDILIAVSSSGASKNILNAYKTARKKGMEIITFSGFKEDNPLRSLGDINFWVDSKAFGFLEVLHGLILHYINDSIIGSEIYMIR